MGRPCAQSINESLKPLSVALSFHLYPPVRQVPYSSAQAEPHRLLKHKPPVEHALHDTGDSNVK